MNRFSLPGLAILAIAGLSASVPASGQAQTGQAADAGVELAFIARDMDVTLLNEGGKYVAIDLKHIAKGERCHVAEGATIVRVGEGEKGTVRVRTAAAQMKSGGCPFMTLFDLPEAEYAAARASFVAKKDSAMKKVDEIKKDLGNKWDELVGNKE
jgi:hypothetical protein